jgi:hypothetical protein
MGILQLTRLALGNHIVHPLARCHPCTRWSTNVFASSVLRKNDFHYYLVPWIPDISVVNTIRLPCCNALSTRNRAYVRRVIDSLYCPDPCPRLQLIVPTFELTPRSSCKLLLGVSEPSCIPPRGRKFDVTFCYDCNLYLRRLLRKRERGYWPYPFVQLCCFVLPTTVALNIPFQILNL